MILQVNVYASMSCFFATRNLAWESIPIPKPDGSPFMATQKRIRIKSKRVLNI